MAVLVDHLSECAGVEQHSATKHDREQAMPATDGELLKLFVHDQGQEAFTELVARHASMVLGVCRRILRDEHEAEDVFQATFLILANKAHQIHRRHPASVAAWLHRVAYRAALRTAQGKHRQGKSLVDDVQSTELEQWLSIARQEEQLLLHEELNKLPELYREAMVLCCLEGMSCNQAAGQLASTPEAVQKRVARGKQMLRMRLVRRGVVAAVALAAAAVPAACEAATLPSLVSLTGEICTATVLYADKSIYSTNVGHIAQQGAVSMKVPTPPTAIATTAALVMGALLLLFTGNAGSAGDSTAVEEVPIVANDDEQPIADSAAFVAARGRSDARADTGVETALEGTWRLVALEKGGKTTDRQEYAAALAQRHVADERLEFSGKEFSIKSGMRGTGGSFTIDPSKMPKWIDVTLPHNVAWMGIYELNDNTLKIFFDRTGDQRPTEFKTKEGTQQVIQTYERVKP